MVTQTLGPYQLGEALATLPFGQLVAATDPARQSRLAILLLEPALAGDVRFRGLLRLAVARAGGLRHPAIARPIEVREADGRLAVLYETPAGQPLAALLAANRVSSERTFSLLRSLADGLDAAHTRGLVHGLLEPSTLLLGPDDSPSLIGLGLLSAVEETGLADLLGEHADLRFVAPEQTAGQRAVETADGYALGVLARYLLAGEQVSAASRVIARQDSSAPSARYPSCRAFVDALTATASGEPAPETVPPAVSQPLSPTVATTAPAASVPEPMPSTYSVPIDSAISASEYPAADAAPLPPAAPVLPGATDVVEATPELPAGGQRAGSLVPSWSAVVMVVMAALAFVAVTSIAPSMSPFIVVTVVFAIFAALVAKIKKESGF